MKLPEISIRRPVLATMMSLSLVLFGIISLLRLPVRELPDIDPPIVSVTTVYPGANASVVETEVTEPLEETLNSIEGIRTLTSQSREQVSNITIEFTLARPIDLAAQDVRDRVSRVRDRLPEDIREPLIAKQDADAFPVLWIGVTSQRYNPQELSGIAERQIKPRFQTISGVSSVWIAGEKRFAMRLWLDSPRMAAHQVTVLDVQNALRAQHVELPSGRVENVDREMTIETRGQLKSAQEFNDLVIRRDGEKIIRLRDIGEARAGVENERTMARANGEPCIFLGIVKQSKANTVEVAAGIKRELEDLKRSIPVGINFVLNYDESIYVQHAIEEVWVTLAIAFILVVVIIFLFLGNLRSTIIPAVAIPVSIIGTFMILQALGYSINILTMLALVLAIGVVVDDAIVVLENIHRHIEMGKNPLAASYEAMKEISFAIIAITISLVAVFLPLAFQTSTTGRLFVEYAVAVAGSVVISAFVALSLTPMMAARILRPIHEHKPNALVRVFDRMVAALTRAYGRSLRWSLGHRFIVLLIGIGSLGLTVLAYKGLEKEFLPEEDKGRLMSFIITPEGSTVEYTDRMVREAEQLLSKVPEVQSYGSVVAPSMNGPGQVTQGILFVRLKDERDRTVQQIVNAPGGLRQTMMGQVEGALAIPQIPKAFGRGMGAPFELVIQGQNLDELNRYVTALAGKLRQSGYLIGVRSSFEVTKPELRISIDRNRAATLGVSIEDISRSMQILFGGLDLARIKIEGKEYDVIGQLERGSRSKPQDLDQLYVRNNQGRLIQLSSLVTREVGAAPNVIEHYNRIRSATISGTPTGVPLGTAMERVEALLTDDLPAGMLYRWGGEARDLREAGAEVWFVLALALVIVYMVLASQFESLVHPFTVILAVPLAGVGALGLLWLLNLGGKLGWYAPIPAMNINLFSQIGLVLLVGLVTKNSILLVEFANQQREQGVDSREAMYQAGIVRLRPILMTAFSTIAGILPIAIGFGAGAESRRPMGVAVVGGMITSTFLTLYIIPSVYSLLTDIMLKLRRKPLAATPTTGHGDDPAARPAQA
ncbi:MAG TPA: efflux RND transporter permease subunit [Methylomirabilota bacterium]|nr:efflux RND transporter permease subunit [Methylomirabilota bacterium]